MPPGPSGFRLVVSPPPSLPNQHPALQIVHAGRQQPARIASVQMATSAPAGKIAGPGEVVGPACLVWAMERRVIWGRVLMCKEQISIEKIIKVSTD